MREVTGMLAGLMLCFVLILAVVSLYAHGVSIGRCEGFCAAKGRTDLYVEGKCSCVAKPEWVPKTP